MCYSPRKWGQKSATPFAMVPALFPTSPFPTPKERFNVLLPKRYVNINLFRRKIFPSPQHPPLTERGLYGSLVALFRFPFGRVQFKFHHLWHQGRWSRSGVIKPIIISMCMPSLDEWITFLERVRSTIVLLLEKFPVCKGLQVPKLINIGWVQNFSFYSYDCTRVYFCLPAYFARCITKTNT